MASPAHPVVVVGAGPAGLAAAQQHPNALVLEAGGLVGERRRDDPGDVVRGVGGAGLYSDGKFSFYPSASALWTLGDAPLLRESFQWTRGLLAGHGLAAPRLPDHAPPQEPGPDGFKPYPSTYLDLDARVALIEALYAPLEDRVRLRTRLESISWDGRHLELAVDAPAGRQTLRCERLVAAGGRFFPLLLRGVQPLRRTFRRFEVGVRVEGPAEHPLFAALVEAGRSIDPKLILRAEDGALEWRTFCCCVDGEVVATRDYGLSTWSGRSDCPPTGRSNVGFNVRFLTSEAARGVRLDRLGGPFDLPLKQALTTSRALAPHLGERAAMALHEGLRRLGRRFPLGDGSLRVIGPTVEGVGDYPALGADLQAQGLPIHFAGDCGGVFRGIVAALVSGAYVGRQVSRLGARATGRASA